MFFSFVSKLVRLWLHVPWSFMHLLISIWFSATDAAHTLRSYLISYGILRRNLNLGTLRYLAIVVESDEAYQISEILKLLEWLKIIGVKQVCLYDMEGILKESKETILAKSNAIPFKVGDTNGLRDDLKHMTLEFTSLSDGKEAIVKAANYLYKKKLKAIQLNSDQEKPIYTESVVSEALKAIGCGGPDPDLLLIYGPVRCHLGFPAWRIRYTEIVHMGPLKSMAYGSLVNAIYEYTRVHQNYGT